MRLLHTSDWHLGRSFHQVGLLPAQAAFVDHVVEVVRSEHVDTVLISGDVYDRALPAPDTVALLSDALVRIVDAGAKVVISSGNHDSAVRLGFASGLLDRAGVHIRSSTSSVGTPVELDGALVYPLPYLEPALTADQLGASERSHRGVLTAAMDLVRADLAVRPPLPAVVMAHAFVTGGEPSDSERDISVGGVSAVSPSVFDGAAYAALGHLHGRQQVSDIARYCGSPLAMSFGESHQAKGSLLVELDTDGATAVTPIDAPVPRRLAVLRGDLGDLLDDPRLEPDEQAWCQVTLTDASRPLGAMDQLRRRFPHTLELRFDPQGAPIPVRSYADRATAASPLDLCCGFLSHVRGGGAPRDEEVAVLAEAIEQSRVGRATRDDEGVASQSRVGAA